VKRLDFVDTTLMNTSRMKATAVSCVLVTFAAGFAIAAAASQPALQSAPAATDKNAILQKARQSYYVLQNEGLKSFQCVIQPNWKQLLEYLMQKPLPANDPKLAMLNALQYSAVIDEQGSVKLTPFRPAAANIDSSVDQVIAEGQQVVDGFFKSWIPMSVTGAFPADQDQNYALSDQPDGYHLIQKVGDATVEMILSKEIVLTAMKVTTSTANILMLPKYSKTEKGLLLNSVDTDINKGTQVVNFQVQYKTVEGFQLPDKVSYQVTSPSYKASFDLNFINYQLTKR
jgi:hypothetical protein